MAEDRGWIPRNGQEPRTICLRMIESSEVLKGFQSIPIDSSLTFLVSLVKFNLRKLEKLFGSFLSQEA